MTDNEQQTAPSRVRRAHDDSGRREQHRPDAPEGTRRYRDDRDGDVEDDELEDDEPADEEDQAEPQDRGRRTRGGPAERRRPAPRTGRRGRAERIPARVAARRAAEDVAEFTGLHPENVVAIEPRDGDWYVDVEVVEIHRIPDTTDVLAIYQVRLDRNGKLRSYRRIRKYSRSQLDKEYR
ncbi:gas vesicle protein GvpO [Pseudonocardia sp. CA-142604]|uniref:gas vesicle protein GvpO n=1 Tax=Pseudonocardia sp. CA-142604 TaxID=3240024 RepID=UPI003D90AC8D